MQAIKLTQGMFAIVDDRDFERVSQYRWISLLSRKSYAVRRPQKNGKRKVIRMHRFILGDIPAGYQVDHINGDTLDNRRSNLRIVLPKQNAWNSRRAFDNKSGFKGVCHYSLKNAKPKWRSNIMKDGIKYHLGYFHSAEDAARAYDVAAIKLFGEFAYLNFPS